MDIDDARALYGERYAGLYDELWEESDAWAPEAELHVEALGRCLGPGAKWLDVGCGTGWILSQFPDWPRAGIDLSPAMLARARAANPDAMLFREGDIRDDVPEWFGYWDLVSSTGQAWSYVDSMEDVHATAMNMARWTSPSGTLFVQPPDITDLTGLPISYNFVGEAPANGSLAITGAVWTYYDEGGPHQDMLFPSLDVWVRWLSKWFRTIEIETWPKRPEFLPIGRRVIFARDKRNPDDLGPAQITVTPSPDAESGSTQVLTSMVPAAPLRAPWDAPGVVDEPRRRLVDRSLSELVGKAAPWRPHLWRSLRYRGRKLVRRA